MINFPSKKFNVLTRIFVLLIVIAAAQSASAQTLAPTAGGPIITWEKTTHDFGDVYQGDKVEHTFAFTNTGGTPLIITNVEVTCGCTTPKGWPRDPLGPGEKGEILIAFNSAGKFGKQNKVVTVISNATNPEVVQISFTANVLEKKSPN
jgi:hypothetical protein